LPRC
jgi:hypothetical protein